MITVIESVSMQDNERKEKINKFLLTSVGGRPTHTMTMLGPDGDVPPLGYPHV
jgi:hypothetical protein